MGRSKTARCGHSGMSSLGKSFKQQRPEGLLVSQEHNRSFVCVKTKALASGFRRASALLTPKQ